MKAKEARRMYDQYVRETGEKPMYVKCCIEWTDDKTHSNVNIAMFPYNNGYNPAVDNDYRIFYYCKDLDEFFSLFEGSMVFFIHEIFEFRQTL